MSKGSEMQRGRWTAEIWGAARLTHPPLKHSTKALTRTRKEHPGMWHIENKLGISWTSFSKYAMSILLPFQCTQGQSSTLKANVIRGQKFKSSQKLTLPALAGFSPKETSTECYNISKQERPNKKIWHTKLTFHWRCSRPSTPRRKMPILVPSSTKLQRFATFK